jgi:hypothetical protein
MILTTINFLDLIDFSDSIISYRQIISFLWFWERKTNTNILLAHKWKEKLGTLDSLKRAIKYKPSYH